MDAYQEEKETLGIFKADYMERRAILKQQASQLRPRPAEDALRFLLKLDQSRNGDMINKLDALRRAACLSTLHAPGATKGLRRMITGARARIRAVRARL